MFSRKSLIVFFLDASILLTFASKNFAQDYFSRQNWFRTGNIYHIGEKIFFNVFQQHRNVNKHIDWLNKEVEILHRKIELVKSGAPKIENLRIEPAREENLTEISVREEMIGKNDFVLKTLSTESIFDRRIVELGEIFSNRTIEAVSVIIENERKTFLFVKTANDEIERFLVEPDRNLTETRERISGSTDRWNSADNRLEFYRRFPDEESLDPDKFSERLSEIRNRQKVSDSNFFEMMGQILRVKYHVDPSSLSCVLEVFFGDIFSCDGRRIFPNELKLLSNENQFFFYAILIDTKTEKQIFPLETNFHIRHGEQIFFLFSNHPQFNDYSEVPCSQCEQTPTVEAEPKNLETPSSSYSSISSMIDFDHWIFRFLGLISFTCLCSRILLLRSKSSVVQQTSRKSSGNSRRLK